MINLYFVSSHARTNAVPNSLAHPGACHRAPHAQPGYLHAHWSSLPFYLLRQCFIFVLSFCFFSLFFGLLNFSFALSCFCLCCVFAPFVSCTFMPLLLGLVAGYTYSPTLPAGFVAWILAVMKCFQDYIIFHFLSACRISKRNIWFCCSSLLSVTLRLCSSATCSILSIASLYCTVCYSVSCSVVFSFTGTEQYWLVPPGVTSIRAVSVILCLNLNIYDVHNFFILWNCIFIILSCLIISWKIIFFFLFPNCFITFGCCNKILMTLFLELNNNK